MGQNATKWIAENFDLEHETRKVEDFYYRVLAGSDEAKCSGEEDDTMEMSIAKPSRGYKQ